VSGTPIGRIKFKFENVNYSVVTVWQSDRGLSISLDKDSEKYPAMNPLRVFKEWANGKGFLNYFPADAAPRAAAPASSQAAPPVDPWDDDGTF